MRLGRLSGHKAQKAVRVLPVSRVAVAAPCVGKGRRGVGADSRFFALLGSAPQELNTVRPEAKLTC
jgi:hypothetical protein